MAIPLPIMQKKNIYIYILTNVAIPLKYIYIYIYFGKCGNPIADNVKKKKKKKKNLDRSSTQLFIKESKCGTTPAIFPSYTKVI